VVSQLLQLEALQQESVCQDRLFLVCQTALLVLVVAVLLLLELPLL
jgi:hypothetical protein